MMLQLLRATATGANGTLEGQESSRLLQDAAGKRFHSHRIGGWRRQMARKKQSGRGTDHPDHSGMWDVGLKTNGVQATIKTDEQARVSLERGLKDRRLMALNSRPVPYFTIESPLSHGASGRFANPRRCGPLDSVHVRIAVVLAGMDNVHVRMGVVLLLNHALNGRPGARPAVGPKCERWQRRWRFVR